MFKLCFAIIGLLVSFSARSATFTVVNLTGTNWTEPSDTNHCFPPGVTVIPATHVASDGLMELGVHEGQSSTVWVDFGGVTFEEAGRSDQETFMLGFTFVFSAGLLAAGARWVKKLIVWGGEEHE